MNAPSKTRSIDCASRRRWASAAALVLPVVLLGCGTATPPGAPPSPHAVGSNDPAWITNRPSLPPPDMDRLNYDVRTRTLTLYDLPGNDRWVVRLPGEVTPRPAAPVFRVPDVDPADVLVYYTRAGMQPSVPVSVKQIQESGGAHVSFR